MSGLNYEVKHIFFLRAVCISDPPPTSDYLVDSPLKDMANFEKAVGNLLIWFRFHCQPNWPYDWKMFYVSRQGGRDTLYSEGLSILGTCLSVHTYVPLSIPVQYTESRGWISTI